MSSRKLLASGLLFDMDGTLVDSNAVVERAWAYWAQKHKLNLAEILDYSHGRPTLATMQHFGERFAPGKDWSVEADELQRMEEEQVEGIKAVPGARELLRHLGNARWAVVTSAPRMLAESRILAAGLPLPSVLVPADEIKIGKPDPEGYLKAAKELAADPVDCVVFEDTPPGIDAGLNAGMQVVGLLTTVRAERLRTKNLVTNFLNVRIARNGNQYEVELFQATPVR